MDTSIQKNVMTRIKDSELQTIDGGTSITGAIINAFTDAVKTAYEFGRSLGSAFRRIKEDKMCEVH